jgi:hypothetical protein
MIARKPVILLSVLMLIVASLACGCSCGDTATTNDAGTAPAEQPAEAATAHAEEPPAEAPGKYDTVFPLPDDARDFVGEGGESDVDFETSLIVDEAVDFYRTAFADQGLTEREANTAITDTTFNLVFDGSANGKAIVVQGVDLGGASSISIRFEDI